MWFRRRNRHVPYSTLERWLDQEGLIEPFAAADDATERHRRIMEYGDLRQRLWAKHIKTLSREEQGQFRDGTHPSQSHRFSERAQPVVRLLEEHLATLGLAANVCPGFYHLDRIVLSAELDSDPKERRSDLPWLFCGYEVKYNWPQVASEPRGSASEGTPDATTSG